MNEKDEKRIEKNLAFLSKYDLVETFEMYQERNNQLKNEIETLRKLLTDLFDALVIDDSIVFELEKTMFDIGEVEKYQALVKEFNIQDKFLTLIKDREKMIDTTLEDFDIFGKKKRLEEKRRINNRIAQQRERKQRKIQKQIKEVQDNTL